MQMAYQSINVNTFSREISFKYWPQMFSNKEHLASPCWWVHSLPFGAEGFFVRLDPNHKHLKEPAALGVSCSHHLPIDPPKSFQLMAVFQCATFNTSGYLSFQSCACFIPPVLMVTNTIHSDLYMLGVCVWGGRGEFRTVHIFLISLKSFRSKRSTCLWFR